MLSAEDRDTLARVFVHSPRYEKLLQRKLQDELEMLPALPPDKVQKHQGRAIMLKEIIDELKAAHK